MDFNSDSSSNQKKNQSKDLIIGVLIVLVIISGIKLYIDYQERTEKTAEIVKLSTQNDALNSRIDSMNFQIDLRIQEIQKLGGSITALEEIKNQLLKERNSAKKRTIQEIASLNEKIDGLNNLIREKDSEIKHLKAANQALFTENQDLKTTQSVIENQVSELSLLKNNLQTKVNMASKLKASQIVISALNPRGKERIETSKDFKNRQIERIKISFNLVDNKLADKGPRNIFMQIMAPNSLPIFDVAKGSGTFMIDGVELFYTAKQDIIFDNSEQILTFYYDKGSDYASGLHEIRIFVDDYQIGSKTFNVK